MVRRIGGGLCAALGVLVCSNAYADVWIWHDSVLERRDENGALVTTIAQAFGAPLGELVRHGEVDPATGNIWLVLRNFEPNQPPITVRVLGLTPNGEEIWQHTETGTPAPPGHLHKEPSFAIDPGRRGIWVLRSVNPPTSINLEAVLYDQVSGAQIARVNGLGSARDVAVGADGAVWITVGTSSGNNRWIRLMGTTQELEGYRVIGNVGPHHRTLTFAGPHQRFLTGDRADGSLYFQMSTRNSQTGAWSRVVVKHGAKGQELSRHSTPILERDGPVSGIGIDPRDRSVYFATGFTRATVVHLSPGGEELGRMSAREHVTSLIFDAEDSFPWIGHMPDVDDDQAFDAPTILRKLDPALTGASVVDVEYPGLMFVIGAAAPAPGSLEVTVDVQPQDASDVVTVVGDAEVRVALLSSASFDPLQVDPRSIRFGTWRVLARSHWARDVNGDGVADLVATFATRSTGIKCGDTAAPLTGRTYHGDRLFATGSLRTRCE